MIEGQTKPLELAKRVLQAETLQAVARSPYNAQGWKILDRWAVNSPDKLVALEKEGEVVLLSRLLEQQNLESDILTSEMALRQRQEGMAEHEILQQNEVPTEL